MSGLVCQPFANYLLPPLTVDVTLEPLDGAETYVNGKQITEPRVLKQGVRRAPPGGPERRHIWECDHLFTLMSAGVLGSRRRDG